MVKAVWNNVVIADSDETVMVDGNHYFPLDAVRAESLQPSTTTSICPWKGTASYYTLSVDGRQNPDAAWFYPEPKAAAQAIKGRVAFWRA